MSIQATPLSSLPQTTYATYAEASVTSVDASGAVTSVAANALWSGDTVSFSAQAIGLSAAGQSGSLGSGAGSQGSANAQSAGDTVSLSDEATALAATASNANLSASLLVASNAGLIASDQLQNLSVGDRLAQITTASGLSLTIDNASATTTGEDNQTTSQSGYLLTVSNGQSAQSYLLTRDLIANQDANGLLKLSGYATGSETSGNDIIIGMSGQALTGGDGNDTIVALAAGGDVSISGGSGDDTIAVTGTAGTVNIDAGDGADTVVAQGSFGNASIATGSGSDTVTLNLQTAGNDHIAVDTGSGSDNVTATVIATGNADVSIGTGSGDDRLTASIVAAGNSRVQADTGSGDDRVIAAVVAGDHAGAGIATGSGDDAVSVSMVATAGARGSIDTGSGDDRLSAVFVANDNAHIQADTGSGDDTVVESFAATGNAHVGLDTGSGDDSVNATWLSGTSAHVNFNLGSGNDSFSGRWAVSRSNAASSDTTTTVATAGLVDAGAGFASYVSMLREMMTGFDTATTTPQGQDTATGASGTASGTALSGSPLTDYAATSDTATNAAGGDYFKRLAHHAYHLAGNGNQTDNQG